MRSLKLKELLGYGVGDAGQALMGTLIGFYQLYYFTDILRLPLPSVAGLFLLTKILDSASFPLFGILLDRIPGGIGAFLKWRLWLIVPSFLISVALFTFDRSWSTEVRIIYAYAVVSAFVVLTALISVVYTGLVSSIATQASDRARLSTIRFVFAFGASTLATFFIKYLVDYLGGKDGGGFQSVAFIFSIIAAATLYITASVTKNRAVAKAEGEVVQDVFGSALRILKNGTFLAPVISTFFTGLFVTFKSQLTLYFINYAMNREDIGNIMLAAGTISCAVGVALVGFVINKIDRKVLYIGLMASNAFFIGVIYFVNHANVFLIIVFHCLNSVLGGACAPVIFSIYSDVVDYLDEKLNFRAPALVNSVAMLAGRLGGSLGMVLTPIGLAYFQYHANQAQTGRGLLGIALMFTLIPAAFALLSALAMVRYTLTNKASEDISDRLAGEAR
ncbi:MAG: MFS transporter [Asticcacaulis sp.]|uniref:MFS transporter n=1 Tax=Asticcacaulis sp. TaxID=1872648 RepID=UPI003F7C6318